MTKVFFLEDEPTILEVTSEYMKMNQYEVTTAVDGKQAIEILRNNQFQIAILDIMVPEISGLEVLSYIQENCPQTATIMLSALGDEQTQVKAFNSYADDYIIKPFSPLLLLKRMEAILRRNKEGANINNNGLCVDSSSYQVYFNGTSLELTLTEFLIMETLYQSPKQVFSREQLLNQIFPDDYYVNDRTIDAHIKNVRKKLPENMIKTVVGIGYQYKEIP